MKYSNRKFIKNFNHRTEEHTDYLKLNHLKYESLKDVKKVDKKLQLRPYFLKSKTIRDEIGREAFIKSEYSDRWDTYKNTNRVNLSKFLKDMLPYVDKTVIKRLKHGKYFRKVVDGLMKNNELLDLAKTPNSYAVVNPRKTQEFFTGDVIRDLRKKFKREKLIDITKDEKWVNKALKEYDLPEPKPHRGGGGKKQAGSSDPQTHFYYSQSIF
ncbi:MAG: hypothetical protein KGY68_06135 [Candidatus Thermoplasmatota archaeon]|nr:hypothetical protein [Candidatus Thermoplasmatota archaeon]